jgi:hypothetical protein
LTINIRFWLEADVASVGDQEDLSGVGDGRRLLCEVLVIGFVPFSPQDMGFLTGRISGPQRK